MTDLLKIGLSALLAQQRAITVTANNIANANTPGYSRQRIELTQRPAERLGRSFVGTGVDSGTQRRITDGFLSTQLQHAQSAFARSDTFAGYAGSLDDLLADSQLGLGARLQGLRNALEDLANDPGASAPRQAFLSEARQIVSLLRNYDARLDDLGAQVDSETRSAVLEINGLGRAIAGLNQKAVGSAGGVLPGDLADQRDELVQRLAGLIDVQTVEQSDGSVSVFIGSGQTLVLGTVASELAVTAGEFGPQRPDIVLTGSGGNVAVTHLLRGGKLGGLLDFRREMLTPVTNEVGRFAIGLGEAVNAVHREGMDANGNLGGDLFAFAGPTVLPGAGNAGAASVAVSIADVGALEPAGYVLLFDGANYQLTDAATGASVAMTGSGTAADPLRAAGLELAIGGAAAAGDRFLIEPLADAAGSASLLIGNAAAVAAAAPIRTRTELGNHGDASISFGEVADIGDPNLLTTTTIEFLSPGTYSINGAGTYAYTSGTPIVVNGARVTIDGAPAAGDRFYVETNAGGVGDSRNALRLSDALSAGLLDGGRTSLQGLISQLATAVGAQTAETYYQRDAQDALRAQAAQSLDSVRGVNLDEEAAKMLEQEQMYQAATRVMAVADLLFQSLISALRG